MRQWVFTPDRGGKPIPDAVKRRVEARLDRYAAEHFAGRYTRLAIRFKAQFCYIDAYTEPAPRAAMWPGATETLEEYMERLRNTPTHLCRLRYYGDEERWGFAFYKYSDEKYETSIGPSGDFFVTPEAGFHTAAEVYLE